MARKRKTFRTKVIKAVKALSRAKHGRPGQGRKTSFIDKKKKADRKACRKKEGEDNS